MSTSSESKTLIQLLCIMHMGKYCRCDEIIYLLFICLSPQDDKDTTSNKESLDDLFPAEDEEQSQSMFLLGCGFTADLCVPLYNMNVC